MRGNYGTRETWWYFLDLYTVSLRRLFEWSKDSREEIFRISKDRLVSSPIIFVGDYSIFT